MDEVKLLFYFSAPANIRKHLMELLFSYLLEFKVHDYPVQHHELIEDLYFLFQFLDKIEELLNNK